MTARPEISSSRGPKTIAVDAMSQAAGGALIYLRYFLEKLAELDRYNEYYVVLRKSVELPELDLPDNVHLVRVGFFGRNLLLRFLYEQLILPVRLAWWGADLLFVSGGIPPLFTPCRKVLMVHNPNPYDDNDFEGFPLLKVKFFLHRWLTGLSVGSLRTIIAVSEWARDRLREELGVPAGKCTVVHHGIDHSLFTLNGELDAALDLPAAYDSEHPLVLAVSTLNPHKNFEVLLEAVGRLRDEDYPVDLVIVGRTAVASYRDKLNRMVREMDLEASVTFHGRVDHERLPGYYRRADAFVLPSRVESFGLTLLEAMASSTPVVASERSSIPEVTDGAASLFDPRDPADLADKMRRITSTDALQQEMVDRGRLRVSRFDWDRSIEETLQLLYEAMEDE